MPDTPSLEQSVAFIQMDISRLIDQGHKVAVKEDIYHWLARELNLKDDLDAREDYAKHKLAQQEAAE